MNDIPMDQWTPEEVEAHIQFMSDFATRLELAASLYADAAHNAPNLPERDHQMRQAARLNQMLRHRR